MKDVRVACGQITWGRGVGEEQVLGEIAQAGYEGAPAGYGPGRTSAETLDLFGRFRLMPAPGYLGVAFWERDGRERILERAAGVARFSREVGLADLYVAPNLTPERRAIAGHVGPRDATPLGEVRKLADLLNEIGDVTLKEGVRACFHNHVGSAIETREEIDALFSLVDPSVVFQGPDLGHLAWAGADVVQFCRDYADRIRSLHVKDIDARVRAEGVARSWDYQTFSEHGVFAELGEGMIDFPAVFEALGRVGFQGWVVVETDVTRKASALQSATISRRYLRSIGV